jgi:hypothetical protein
VSDEKLETIGLTLGIIVLIIFAATSIRSCSKDDSENQRACIAAGGDVISGNCIRRAK